MFSENKIFEQSFGQKTCVLNWCIHPKTTSLFIGEINGQLGKLSTQI